MAAATNAPAGPRAKHPELNGTVVIYSPYINKQKTIQEGRRIPQEKACDDPTAWEILEVCKRLFPEGCVDGENKGYSRDYEAQWPPMRGRIRVTLFKDGQPTVPEITTRKQLFLKVAETIPKMTSRQPGYVDPNAQPMSGGAGGGGGGSTSTNKKKNKKK
mmetsp:Transcript_55054/g.112514  ORF Transcript_55054/g.112514 Transcript_55054/m.112514 type:complete len:160 (-) Transcript_55054:401-880(-)|eukprot:CAMPEP_0181289848 /NCGR_PEP_ID=MMETSP1101-20121128/1102_1 /TAXON_ID=46948 /ORGANISM="Rhodomonas abbreviata, Strain Caron Lab Isolate" /LENGTH=159 /DNA_ID=CAMNT_0023394099 /DNA_START=123 /DNA_END=602 /DNA_ORIENTATION=-